VSDHDRKNIEQQGEEAETADGIASEPASLVEAPEPHTQPEATAPEGGGRGQPQPAAVAASPRGGFSSFIAWLALLLVLALAGAAGWSVLELQRREAALVDRLQALEGSAGEKGASVAALEELQTSSQALQRRLDAALADLQRDSTGQAQLLQALETRLEEQLAALEQQRSQLTRQGEALSRIDASDRESWLLAEVEYLLRLANQRLIMTGDVAAARALLDNVDGILRDLDDAALHPVRAAVASDLAALRAVPEVDVEGIYLRLGALLGQAGELAILRLPAEQQALQPPPQPRQEAAPGDWQQQLQQGWESALHALSDYLTIRRRDVPVEALMDPRWEGLVRQNLRMLLEQARVALLSGNQALYRESLDRARYWVTEFFQSDEATARSMAREIDQLSAVQVDVALPDVSASLAALNDAMEQRLQQGGVE
jgi:uroporphyrin-3 C-methyltransferase